MSKTMIALVVGIVIVVAIPSLVVASQRPHDSGVNDLTISWQRTGGIAGISDQLIVYPNGSAVYSSSRLGTSSLTLNGSALAQVLAMVAPINSSKSYSAKAGAADYFGYRLTLSDSRAPARVVEWVDGWASMQVLPDELVQIQSFMTSLVQGARG